MKDTWEQGYKGEQDQHRRQASTSTCPVLQPEWNREAPLMQVAGADLVRDCFDSYSNQECEKRANAVAG